MNSEKVKEIKEKLKKQYYYLDQAYSDHLAYGGKGDDKQEEEIYFLGDILTYINELEGENERLKEENRILLDKDTLLEMVGLLSKEKDILLNRIAELEKEIKENPSYAKGYADGIKNTYEAMLPQTLENFAEMLKEKCEFNRKEYCCEATVSARDIDETLKEFMGEKFDNEVEE